jgi:hypothetical protein
MAKKGSPPRHAPGEENERTGVKIDNLILFIYKIHVQ